jgi:hypothetical protein
MFNSRAPNRQIKDAMLNKLNSLDNKLCQAQIKIRKQ